MLIFANSVPYYCLTKFVKYVVKLLIMPSVKYHYIPVYEMACYAPRILLKYNVNHGTQIADDLSLHYNRGRTCDMLLLKGCLSMA